MTDAEKVKNAQEIKNLIENLPAVVESLELSAKLTRIKFLALVKQGFTEIQALELCR